MAKDLEPKYSETTKRADAKATERNPKRTSTAPRSPCRGRNLMLRNSSIISGPAAQPQTFHLGMIAKGQTSRFVEELSSDEDLQSLMKNTGAAKTFDEMPLPPGKVRSATACEEQTKEQYIQQYYLISNIQNRNNAMPEKESKPLPKMNISSAWALLQKVSTLINNLSKSQEEAQLSRNTDSQAIEKLKNKVTSLENELKGVNQDFERRIRQLESVIYRSK
ncbi:hypothetical protein BPAE_0031g00720 [Botrytis paeoniae]|uniref:Uncharacterized protein n=1 Tax=Botrytis paeoniae TaxID=278948 RepID=A0A4Z1FUL5_9HELO|nr:hypothetical protein BPAE_0031g00720 [Botrytis paeoniae]